MLKRWLAAMLVASGLLYTMPAAAEERVEVCAKYQRSDYSWSKTYSVTAILADGSELNTATGTWSYDAFSKYVVIYWAQDETSIIKLGFPALGPFGQRGKDKNGRTWEVSTSSGYCF